MNTETRRVTDKGKAAQGSSYLCNRPLQLQMHVLYASRIIRTGLSILQKTELLSFEELERLAKLFVGRFGVEKSG